MARSVPKCKRAAYVYDRDFIVVDDISGVLKMRSECAIDGYGFLSSQGDMRNPQEIPPIINEQMAAWPDPRPIGQPIFTPEPDYQYFIFNYTIFDVVNGSSSFDATTSIGFNAPIASIAWSIDGVYAATGLVVTLSMSAGDHVIDAVLTDTLHNTTTFTINYTQPSTTPGFSLPFSSSVTFDTQGNAWVNKFGLAVISDSAMYTGTTGFTGAENSSDSLLAFGLADFEVGVTVKLVSIPVVGSVLFDSFRLSTLGGEGFQLYVYSNGRLSFYQKNSPLNEIKTVTPVVFTGIYYTIKAVRIAGVVSLYVDDVLVASGSMNVSFNSNWTAIGYQYFDNGYGYYPSRGYFRNVYARLI